MTTSRSRPFRDIHFCYWLDGQRLYSPARVLRDLGLKPSFDGVDANVVLRAAQRGKLVEDYCYRLMLGQPVTIRAKHCGTLRPDVTARVEGFQRWRDKYKPEYVDHQGTVWSPEDRIAWKRDMRVRINGTLYLADIKCTSKVERHWPLELGCGLSYDEDGCEHAGILRLGPFNKQGYQWRNGWKGRQLVGWWKRLVAKWHADYDFKILKAELGFDSEAVGFEVEEESE